MHPLYHVYPPSSSNICCQLPLASRANFRLVSRAFSEIGKEHLVPELYFFRHVRRIAKVIEISKSPDWAKYVRVLVYEVTELKGWDEIVHENKFYFDCNVQAARQAWERHYEDQSFFRQLNLKDLLQNALERFTNLKCVVFHAGFHEPRGAYKRYKYVTENIAHIGSFKEGYPYFSEVEQWLWEDRASMRVFEELYVFRNGPVVTWAASDVASFFDCLEHLGLEGIVQHPPEDAHLVVLERRLDVS